MGNRILSQLPASVKQRPELGTGKRRLLIYPRRSQVQVVPGQVGGIPGLGQSWAQVNDNSVRDSLRLFFNRKTQF